MNIAILLAAGSSQRAGMDKLWIDIEGKPLWTHAYQTLMDHPDVRQVWVAVPSGQEGRFTPYVREASQVVAGGETRMQSFKNALAAIHLDESDVILDQSAANPWVTPEEITAVIEAAQKYGAAAVYQPAVDTVLEVDKGRLHLKDREKLRLMQTPQAVRGDILKSLELADATDLTAALLEHVHVELLPAHPRNKKITFADDLENPRARKVASTAFLHFLGEDSHRFSDSGTLKLGGLTVENCPAMIANSDGDVILHALGRALAQAKGVLFSDTADALCGQGETDSTAYLKPLLQGLNLRYVSISLEGARPKIDPLIMALKASLAKILELQPEQISFSVMSGEDLSAFGKGEGLRCAALITVQA